MNGSEEKDGELKKKVFFCLGCCLDCGSDKMGMESREAASRAGRRAVMAAARSTPSAFSPMAWGIHSIAAGFGRLGAAPRISRRTGVVNFFDNVPSAMGDE